MENITFTDHAGVKITAYKWVPKTGITPKGLIQIVHGMAEHALRYDFLAEALTDEGFVVYAEDHRGHGKTMESMDKAGSLNPDGWDGVVKDLKQLKDIMVKDYPDLPVFMFGHSWGSFLTQDFIQKWGDELKGIILSGTAGKQDTLGLLILIAKLQVKLHGSDTPAGLIYKLGVEPLNKRFEPAKSASAWLSTVEEEVQKYDDDPLCGYRPPNGYYLEMAYAMKRLWKKENESKIPKNLPIYMIVGELDPVGNFTKNFMPLVHRYQNQGIADVSYKIYKDARHEILNDYCRKEVVQDTVNWFNNHM
ncbi:lysophospholipase [Candidatus Lokiarchaeum ossiferum]|uniref:lysophospholipase n=1 Tax=Candidatus Lokiarchaeum ossiferum TaxID=2951803 RepID=UPI00352FA7C5